MHSVRIDIRPAVVSPTSVATGRSYELATRSLDQQPVQRRDITEIRIMIVEDSDAVHAVLYNMVTRIPGLSVAGGFSCVSSALEGIRSDPPDVVLLDIQLQGESGMKVMQGVAESHPSTKVIVVSNYADAIYRRHYMNAGAYAFFDKSHDLKKLRHTLENLAASRATALHSPVRTSNIA